MHKSLALFLMLLLLGSASAFSARSALAQHGEATEEEAEGEEGTKEEGAGEEEEETISGGEVEGDPIFTHVPPMVIPVINEAGIQQIVSLMVSIQVKDRKAAELLRKNMPKVKDALLRHLYGGFSSGELLKKKTADIRKIKHRARIAVEEVAPPDIIVDILVESISQRML